MHIIASCAPACDPSYIFANQAPGEIRFWTVAALCCGVLLLAEAVVIALRLRPGMRTWRSVVALLPGLAGGIVLVLVLRAWSASMGVTANPTIPTDYEPWFQHLQSTWYAAVTLGAVAFLGTIVMLVVGFFFVAATERPSQPAAESVRLP